MGNPARTKAGWYLKENWKFEMSLYWSSCRTRPFSKKKLSLDLTSYFLIGSLVLYARNMNTPSRLWIPRGSLPIFYFVVPQIVRQVSASCRCSSHIHSSTKWIPWSQGKLSITLEWKHTSGYSQTKLSMDILRDTQEAIKVKREISVHTHIPDTYYIYIALCMQTSRALDNHLAENYSTPSCPGGPWYMSPDVMGTSVPRIYETGLATNKQTQIHKIVA